MSDARTLARNTAAKYAALAVDALTGLLLLPYNIGHLGQADYGLWILSASVARYVGFLDLGFGGGLVKFVAECRALRQRQRLNEIVSTVMVAFAITGAVAFLIMAGVAFFFDRIFHVDARQAAIGRTVLILTAARLAVGFPVSVFGGVINGAQRYALNNMVSIVATLLVAAVNVWVVERGGGVVDIVTATTVVATAAYGAYVANAYRVQPGLRVSPSLASSARLREVGSFSLYLLVLDWAHKVNYSLDTVVIGAALGPRSVAAFTPAVRVAQTMRDLTGQFHGVLFPAVVDLRTRGDAGRLRALLLEGTRATAALAVAASIGVTILATPLLVAWVGRDFAASGPVLQILCLSMLVRVAQATGATILKGHGGHRYLAAVNALVGVVNLVLSIALVRPLGIVGVALGTAIPVCGGSLFIIPETCRRLGVPVARFWREALWPAVWPALPVAVGLALWRDAAEPTRLIEIVAAGAVAAAAYLGLVYVLAFGPADRALAATRVRAVLGRSRPARRAARPARAGVTDEAPPRVGVNR